MDWQLFKRVDGRWAWRLVASNGNIVATDGGQGYENKQDAVNSFDSIQNAIREERLTATTVEF